MAETGGWFVIDAETGDESQFSSSPTEEGSNTFEASADAKNNGSYGFKLYFAGSDDECYAVKTFDGAKTDVYVRAYVNLNSPTIGQYESVFLLTIRDGATRLAYVGANKGTSDTGNPTRWIIGGQSLDGGVSSEGFALSSWLRIELRWYAGSGGADGGIQCWVDGQLAYSEFDTDLTAYAADDVLVGNDFNGTAPSESTIYIDDIKADGSAIGEYSDAGAGGSIVPIVLNMRRRRA